MGLEIDQVRNDFVMKTTRLIASRSHRLAKARGITLVELLVVVMIMVLLMSVAIPLLKQPLADRKLREAARQVTAFLQTAQAQAAERGRPVAVMFLRASSDIGNP